MIAYNYPIYKIGLTKPCHIQLNNSKTCSQSDWLQNNLYSGLHSAYKLAEEE